MAAFVTTLTLSPIANTPKGSTAGAFDDQNPEIKSNLLPVEMSDLNQNSTTYKSQLVKVDDRAANYFITLEPNYKQIITKPLLKLQNNNNAPVSVSISINLPPTVATSLNVGVVAPTKKHSLYNSRTNANRTIVVELPAKQTTELQVEFEYLQNIAFQTELALQVTY